MLPVYLGLGSNLGDRRGNILQALQKLRSRCRIEKISSYYEIPAMGRVEGPPFLNIAVSILSDLKVADLEKFLRETEKSLGRRHIGSTEARLIDIDMLYADGCMHPKIAERLFNGIPLAEIEPELRDPVTGATLRELFQEGGAHASVKKLRSLHFLANKQEEEPEIKLSINRAGVSRVKRIIRLTLDGRESVFHGEFSMVADLSPEKAGVHMSRFSELLEEATLDVLAGADASGRIEEIVSRIARKIVVSQKALRAEVRLRSEFGLERWTPVSGLHGEEIYTLLGIAHADAAGERRIVGVEAEGMTACPCAQLMMRENGLRELTEAGFSEQDANRAMDALPVATHNQRGRGSLFIGTQNESFGEIRIADLIDIVENAMSSETYDLLKRPDEFFIVNKAHHNPKFVEDVVRGMMMHTLDMYADFPDETFLSVSQVNYESIHKHDAFAESFGTFGQLREELRRERYVTAKTDMVSWMEIRP